MSKQFWILSTLLFVFSNGLSAANDLHTKVDIAFDAVRNGDYSKTDALVLQGQSIIPLITPNLSDPNESVRRETVLILTAIGGYNSAIALLAALEDTSSDIREYAALGVYSVISIEGEQKFPKLEKSLIHGNKHGDMSAAAILLLAYVKNAEGILRLTEQETRSVKFMNEDLPVDIALVARVALSFHGDKEARTSILKSINVGKIEELTFFLKIVNTIDSPEILQALANKTLNDVRETAGGVPAGATPSRRIADVAVETFISRFSLKPIFKVKPSRQYNLDEISQIKIMILETIPQ